MCMHGCVQLYKSVYLCAYTKTEVCICIYREMHIDVHNACINKYKNAYTITAHT